MFGGVIYGAVVTGGAELETVAAPTAIVEEKQEVVALPRFAAVARAPGMKRLAASVTQPGVERTKAPVLFPDDATAQGKLEGWWYEVKKVEERKEAESG